MVYENNHKIKTYEYNHKNYENNHKTYEYNFYDKNEHPTKG